ncbi:hypothetical protein E5Q_04434, partial [Mixia osmundae IAM 14324]
MSKRSSLPSLVTGTSLPTSQEMTSSPSTASHTRTPTATSSLMGHSRSGSLAPPPVLILTPSPDVGKSSGDANMSSPPDRVISQPDSDEEDDSPQDDTEDVFVARRGSDAPSSAGAGMPSLLGSSLNLSTQGEHSVPPSPSSSTTPFVAQSSLALRRNDDPDGQMRAKEKEKEALKAHHRAFGARQSLSADDALSPSPVLIAGNQSRHIRKTSGVSITSVLSSTETVPDRASDLSGSPISIKGELPAKHEDATTEKALERRATSRSAVQANGLARLPVVGRLFARKTSVDETEEPSEKKSGLVVPELPDPSPAEMGPFTIPPSKLAHIFDPKSVDELAALGGSDALLQSLHSDQKNGLVADADGGGRVPGASIADRQRIFGANKLPTRQSKSLLKLMWLAMQDKVLIILSIAAVVSLALGLYQDLGTPAEVVPCPTGSPAGQVCTAPQVDYVEGVAIIAAILIVVIIGSVNDYQKERQFRRLNAQKEDRNVKAIRSGAEQLVNVHDVVAGDILLLEPGEILPVDGIFLEGHNVKCDESSATGESDAIKKDSYNNLVERRRGKGSSATGKDDCFLLSGSKVVEGQGRYLVASVGQHSFNGKIMMSLQGESENTPLQLKLNRLAELIAKLGSAAGLLLFGVLMIRFFVQLSTNPNRTPDQKGQSFIQILIIAVTVVVVAVPEGLPLAVTLALAFATRRMTKENLLVRVLGSCETMANATVICTDKTGTLTQNKMTVVAGSLGVHLKFAHRLANEDLKDGVGSPKPNDTELNTNGTVDESVAAVPSSDRSFDISDLKRELPRPVQDLINSSVAINTTAFEGRDEHGEEGFVGSKTEVAMLLFAMQQEWPHYRQLREEAKIMQLYPFSSERKAMGVVVALATGGYRFYIKGASEIVTARCASAIVADQSSDHVQTNPLTRAQKANLDRTIMAYANSSLRTIAMAYKDFEQWPPASLATAEDGSVEYKSLANDLVFVGIVGLADPLREGVTDAVAQAIKAGVSIKMVTGDNPITARAIAQQCGILQPGGVIMDGPAFRKLSEKDMFDIAPRLQVLARSSPTDKQRLVEHLKACGEVVGVTGDGLNDGPALKSANVGFSMGIAGTEVAKEASDIILMDDNFASIVTAIMWGRCVNDAVRKFLQFQISVNIVAVLLTFISAVASSEERSVLTAVQLLWVNLIMDTFAALALATDPATPESLNRKPDPKTAPLINVRMWRLIIAQSIYQLVTTLVLHFAGNAIFGNHAPGTDMATRDAQDSELNSLVFNTFVFCQIFNQLNARRLDDGQNIFAGVFRNIWFLLIFSIMVGGQILIIFVGGAAFSVTRISGRDWAISISMSLFLISRCWLIPRAVLGALCLPLGAAIRFIPADWLEGVFIKCLILSDPHALPTATQNAQDREDYGEGINRIRDNLATFGQIRGGRMRSSSLVLKSRSKQLE